MELSQADAGRRCAIRVGDTVTISLPESPTTGYRWHPEVDTDFLAASDDSYEGAQDPRGAPGIRRLAFTAVRTGSTTLRLVRRRSWESTGVEAFEIPLDVE